jgi:very-short-patch-repair endonuclease
MRHKPTQEGRANARRLRRTMTPPEARLWTALRAYGEGLHFRHQHPAGPFTLDFFCARAALAIEVDGEGHGRGDQPARDARRDGWCASRGILVLRVPAVEVLRNLEGVVRLVVVTARERIEEGW